MRDGSRSATDREAHVPSSRTPTRRNHHPILPPWGVRSIAQIPFLQPGSPSPARRNEQSFFTARSTSHVTRRPRLNTMDSAESGSEYSYPVDEQTVPYPWIEIAPTPSNQHSVDIPYETTIYHRSTCDRPANENSKIFSPAFRKAASQPPFGCSLQAPPTPPDSVSRASIRSATASSPLHPASKAMPGTMSSRTSRNRPASHNKVKPGSREHRTDRTQVKHSQVRLGKRLKRAIRDIFKKDPVEDSRFERISERHWTDDYWACLHCTSTPLFLCLRISTTSTICILDLTMALQKSLASGTQRALALSCRLAF
jgi:hypothetical protein